MRGELGDFVEQQRKKIKLTKTALAEQSGLSRQGLYKILNGDVGQVQLSTLVSLATALQIHPIILIQKLFQRWEFPSVETNGAIYQNDSTGFIGDITYPDNSIVSTSQLFTKIWRSQNIGKHTWQGCRLKCFDDEIEVSSDSLRILDQNRGLKPVIREVNLPIVNPGETVDIEVNFTAPDYPCTAISYWKMVDSKGNICFPLSEGLSCLVHVIDFK